MEHPIYTACQEGKVAKYTYFPNDASGNRVKKMVRTSANNWETTVYVDGVFEYQRIETATDTYERNNLHVMDDKSRIAQVRIGSDQDDISDPVTYILDDHLGSSNARLNTSGGVIDREEYFPFGDSSLRTFSKKRYRYVGKEKDSESGLYYYGMRYYSAWTCRFVSVDPLYREYAYYTPYQYAGNKPIVFIDLDGLEEVFPGKGFEGGDNIALKVAEGTKIYAEAMAEFKDKVGGINIMITTVTDVETGKGKLGGETSRIDNASLSNALKSADPRQAINDIWGHIKPEDITDRMLMNMQKTANEGKDLILVIMPESTMSGTQGDAADKIAIEYASFNIIHEVVFHAIRDAINISSGRVGESSDKQHEELYSDRDKEGNIIPNTCYCGAGFSPNYFSDVKNRTDNSFASTIVRQIKKSYELFH